MLHSVRLPVIVAALTLSATTHDARAEEIHFKQICQGDGSENVDKLGNGHVVSSGPYSCRMVSGPVEGAVVTGQSLMEWDDTGGVILAGSAVIRKPGSFVAYQDTEGKIALTTTDGKVTGFTGSGKVRYLIATGSAAPMAGKTISYTIKSTGADQWEADGTAD